MSDIAAIRALYEQEFRREVTPPAGARLERSDRVIRSIGSEPAAHANRIHFSALDVDTAEAAISDQLHRFGDLGHAFEWPVFDGDQPSDLIARLTARGFVAEPAEAVMVLDLQGFMPSPALAAGIDLRRIMRAGDLGDVLAVQDQVWNEDHGWLVDMLSEELDKRPARISIFCAYADGEAVSNGWIRYGDGPSFASLNGGSTLPGYRGKGIYRALIDCRAREAIERGIPFLTVDASPMSRPILERNGFQFLCMATPCIWSPG
jgi:GNAT superfamily N-acetyltransferase